MKAVRYHSPSDVRVEDVDTPTPGPGELVIRVGANTICGTDLRIVRGLKKKGVIAPRILGHEVSGVIDAIGEGVEAYSPGDTVGICPTYSCGGCYQCQRGRVHLCENALVLGHQTDGGMAEFIRIPARAVADGVVVSYTADLDPAAAALAEPLSCIIHGQRFLNIGVGDTVLVMGGGAIGLLHSALAELSGAHQVILSEPMEFRRNLGSQFGVSLAVDPTQDNLEEAVLAATGGQGADVVIVCIGIPALVNQAMSLSAKHGRVSLFAGFPAGEMASVDPNLVHYRELTVVGSSNSTVPDYQQAMALLETGRIVVDPLITHRFSLEEYDQAVETISAPDAIKVAIIPTP